MSRWKSFCLQNCTKFPYLILWPIHDSSHTEHRTTSVRTTPSSKHHPNSTLPKPPYSADPNPSTPAAYVTTPSTTSSTSPTRTANPSVSSSLVCPHPLQVRRVHLRDYYGRVGRAVFRHGRSDGVCRQRYVAGAERYVYYGYSG